MKIRTGFVSNSSSSSFIIGTKDRTNSMFSFSLDDFRNFLISDYGCDVDDADGIMASYEKELSNAIGDGFGIRIIDIENGYSDVSESLIEMFGGKVIIVL